MDEEILLFIITDKGNMAIPFRSLLEVDNYMIRFENIACIFVLFVVNYSCCV